MSERHDSGNDNQPTGSAAAAVLLFVIAAVLESPALHTCTFKSQRLPGTACWWFQMLNQYLDSQEQLLCRRHEAPHRNNLRSCQGCITLSVEHGSCHRTCCIAAAIACVASDSSSTTGFVLRLPRPSGVAATSLQFLADLQETASKAAKVVRLSLWSMLSVIKLAA